MVVIKVVRKISRINQMSVFGNLFCRRMKFLSSWHTKIREPCICAKVGVETIRNEIFEIFIKLLQIQNKINAVLSIFPIFKIN